MSLDTESPASDAEEQPAPKVPVARSRIVVGYSSRPEGRAALARALVEAELRGSELIVLHTAEDDVLQLRAELDATGQPYELRPSDDALDPAEDLIVTAEDAGAAFIVIGLRRRSPVGKLLLGSNAQRVLLDASCPVLAVKA